MTSRVLPVEEWNRLDRTYLGPLRPTLHPETCQVLVVEDGGAIVGTWALMRVWHVEGLSGVGDVQTNGVIGRHLLRGMRTLTEDIPAVVTNADTPVIAEWLVRLGGQKIVGEGYVWRP